MTVVPLTLAEANAFVSQHHRHHGPVVGHKFSMGVMDGPDRVAGVCIVGRPVARGLDDGWTLEVTRCCTDGTPNAASALYGAARRAAFALGYRRLVTYTLASEPGTSLRAAGWRVVGEVTGRSWSCPSRPRLDLTPWQDKLRWEALEDLAGRSPVTGSRRGGAGRPAEQEGEGA
jgi:hypothetical protein